MFATLMSRIDKNISHQNQIQEIHNLIEKASLIRDEQLGVSNTLLEKAFELSDNLKYTIGKGISLRELSVNYLRSRLFKNAVKTLEEAATYFADSDDVITYRKCLNELSDIYFTLGDYELCLETLLLSMQVSKDQQDKVMIAEVYNKIGNIYKVIGEFQKAIEQHQQALIIFEELGNEAQVSVSNYHIGNCYNWADELDVAFNFLDKSLQSASQLRDATLKISPLGSLAILFTKTKNYQKAEAYFFQAIEAVDHAGNLKVKADLLKSLGNLYYEQGIYDKAITTLAEALQITTKLDIKNPTNLIHLFLSNTYERTGDFKQALYHLKLFTELNRDITNEEIAIKTKGLQLKFDLEEVKKQKELAEHSANLKDRFLSGMSHELRTPLNGVLGMANLLTDTHPTPEQLEYINTIKLSANNLISIIDDILDYSKIKAGEVELTNELFNPVDLVTTISQSFKSKANQKQLEINLKINQEVPQLISGDKLRLGQILNNLIGNAIKFTEKGRIDVDLKSSIQSKEMSTFVFTISDTGVGIAEDRQMNIFEVFSREQGDVYKFTEGTGLGLAIVKQLVDLLKGKISLSSRLNEGTVFTVELPFKTSEVSTSSGNMKGEVVLRNLSEISLLLVEDNKVNQFLGKQILTKLGFQVKIAGNGREALEIINSHHFDLILMDVNMPVMNGYDLTQLIRNQIPAPKNAIPIVALTAYASGNEKEKALGLGMNDYITKPYSPEELLHVIIKQLNLKLPAEKVQVDSPAVVNQLPSENFVVVDHLRKVLNGSEEDLRKMLEMYIEQIPAINAKIKAAILKKDWEEVFQQAHKLKSSVKILEINRMSELITMIEEYAKAGENTELVNALFEAFKKEGNWVVKKMQEYLA